MADCWDTENMELMTDDCFEFIRVLYLEPFLHKYSRICTYIMLIIHFPLWSIQFFYFLKTFDIYIIAQYGPASMAFFYALMSSMIPLIYEKHIETCLNSKQKHFWSLRLASKKLQRIMLRVAKYYVYVAKINIVLAVLCYTMLLMRFRAKKEWELFYQITFFEQHFSKHAFLITCIFYASLAYFIIPMLLAVNLLAYFVFHTAFQAMMLGERVRKITEGYNNDIKLFDDDIYQRQVFKRMRFCLQRFAVIESYTETSLRIIPRMIVFYCILGICLMTSYVAGWYLDPDIYYPLLVILVICTCYTVLISVEMGQLTEDQSRALYNIFVTVPWYTFNVKNQKMVLTGTLLINRMIRISPFKAFPINRKLIVQSYKVFTSLSALLANTSDGFNR